jgi:hypothetical protein
MKKEAVLILFSIILVSGVYGQMMISEIMYQSSGEDTKKEWTELYNNGQESVNISKWKLKAGDTIRELIPYRGTGIINPGSFAIVARNGENFSEEYPAYTGEIVSITLALSNEGNAFSLLNQANEVVDFVNYTDIAEKGYTIELNGSDKDNSNMDNWIQGILRGNPGEIIEYAEPVIPPVINETLNETVIPDNNQTEEINQTYENNSTETNSTEESQEEENNNATVPEFNFWSASLALVIAGAIFVWGRNR